MTSDLNDQITRDFFKRNRFFGIEERNVFFFKQVLFDILQPLLRMRISQMKKKKKKEENNS